MWKKVISKKKISNEVLVVFQTFYFQDLSTLYQFAISETGIRPFLNGLDYYAEKNFDFGGLQSEIRWNYFCPFPDEGFSVHFLLIFVLETTLL